MPCLPYSRATVFVRPFTPHFEEMYGERPGVATSPPVDAVLTIAPLPFRFFALTSVCKHSCVPSTLTLRARFQSSDFTASIVAVGALIPALLCAHSSFPYVSTALFTSCSTSHSSATFHLAKIA